MSGAGDVVSGAVLPGSCAGDVSSRPVARADGTGRLTASHVPNSHTVQPQYVSSTAAACRQYSYPLWAAHLCLPSMHPRIACTRPLHVHRAATSHHAMPRGTPHDAPHKMSDLTHHARTARHPSCLHNTTHRLTQFVDTCARSVLDYQSFTLAWDPCMVHGGATPSLNARLALAGCSLPSNLACQVHKPPHEPTTEPTNQLTDVQRCAPRAVTPHDVHPALTAGTRPTAPGPRACCPPCPPAAPPPCALHGHLQACKHVGTARGSMQACSLAGVCACDSCFGKAAAAPIKAGRGHPPIRAQGGAAALLLPEAAESGESPKAAVGMALLLYEM